MPTYQYACTECEHAFDQVQSFTDDTLTSCPECTGRLRKVFNAVGVVFKGSGFYRNDSRGKDKSSESSGSSDTKRDTKAESKSETKSEKKAETKSSDSATKTPAASATTSG